MTRPVWRCRDRRVNRSRENNLRRLRCDGCPHACSYRDFVLPELRGLGPGKNLRHAADLRRLGREAVPGETLPQLRIHTLLGTLHQMKWEAWERETAACREAVDRLGEVPRLIPRPVRRRRA